MRPAHQPFTDCLAKSALHVAVVSEYALRAQPRIAALEDRRLEARQEIVHILRLRQIAFAVGERLVRHDVQQDKLGAVLGGDVTCQVERFVGVLGAVEGHQDPLHASLR
jgi:hypothetical protein